MRLEQLFVDGFRNLDDVTLTPHPRLTVIVGDNGQGKTNLLEAIHLVSALRPLRTTERANELVGFARERGRLHGRFALDGPLEVEVNVEQRGRKATVGGKAVRDVATLAAQLGVVSFVPEDSAMIRGSPGDRRRGLDRFAFSLLPGFAAASRRFEDALEQRNRLLKDPVVDEAALDAFTPPFIEAAADLTRLRCLAASRWAPAFAAEAEAIGGDALCATLAYHSGSVDGVVNVGGSVGDGADVGANVGAVVGAEVGAIAAHLAQRLKDGWRVERKKRSTLCGPQHDELVVQKADRAARFLASQGEARALVLALKLAAVRVLTEAKGQAPLLLLDDVAGELDASRQARLLQAVDETGAQCFVTTTSTATLPALGAARVVTVVAGTIAAVADLDGGAPLRPAPPATTSATVPP
jgi:DNA replication and repair protein RecF